MRSRRDAGGPSSGTRPTCAASGPVAGLFRSHVFDAAYVCTIVDGSTEDAAIARLAEAQYGVVVREQLLIARIGRKSIQRRVRDESLHEIHPLVYAVGHRRLPPGGAEFAVVAACGPHAALARRAAATWHGLRIPPSDEIDVVVAGNRNPHPPMRPHRTRQLPTLDVEVVRGVPVTTTARTLLDLAETETDRVLEQVAGAAVADDLLRPHHLEELLARSRGRHGLARLDVIRRAMGAPRITRSEAEERLLHLIRSAGLPLPEVNARVAGLEVDFLWRAERLVVEVDGYAYHSSRAAFEEDRRRDARLGDLGLRVRRVTWRQIVDDPLYVVALITRALVGSGP